MTELDLAWARTQIEALADDSLSPEARRRMDEILAAYPSLAAELAAGQQLRRDLRRLARQPAPPGLLLRLWRIPAPVRRPGAVFRPATALAVVAVAVLGIGALLRPTGPDPMQQERDDAVQDFAIALAYLQRSADLARTEVNEAMTDANLAMTDGVRGALEVSRQALNRVDVPAETGDTDNVD